MHDLSEELVLGGTVDSDSVDRTAIQTARVQASANALYEVATAHWEEVCEMLDIPVKEEDEREGDPAGVAGINT